MNTKDILQQQLNTDSTKDFIEHLQNPKWIHVRGLCGSGVSLLVSSVYMHNQRPILLVAPNKEEALYLKSDLEHLLTGQTVNFLPDSFVKTYRYDREHALNVQERIETLNALRKNAHRIVVTFGSALAEHVVQKSDLENNSFEIQRGQNLDFDFLTLDNSVSEEVF